MSDDDNDEIDRELVAIDDLAHVDLPELEDLDVDREPVPAGEGGLSAYFRRIRAERPLAADATLRRVDSLTRLHRAPIRATAEYRFSSPQDEEEHERERIRLARESLAQNERRLDEQERHREETWQLQETLLFDSIATLIRESAAAPPPPSRRQQAAARRGRLPTGVCHSTSTAAAAQQRGPTNRQSNRSRSRPSRRSTSAQRRGPQVGGQAGAFLPSVQLQGTNLPPSNKNK